MIAPGEDGDEAVALRRQADREAVDRERDAERVERLRVRGDRSVSLRPRGISFDAPTHHEPNASPSVTSWSTNSHQTKSSSAPQRRGEGQHRRQREPVVEPGLEVERVAHEPRHARVRDDGRGEHRVGRRQQRAEQERLEPVEADDPVRDRRDDRAPVIGIASASLRNGRCHAVWSISASTSRPSRNRITISAIDRQVVDEARPRVEVEHLRARRRRARSRPARTAPPATGTTAATSPATSAPEHQQARRGRAARSRASPG